LTSSAVEGPTEAAQVSSLPGDHSACARWAAGICSASVASILENGLDRQPVLPQQAELALPDHANVRGPDYYH
jgi:hypothetical protein